MKFLSTMAALAATASASPFQFNKMALYPNTTAPTSAKVVMTNSGNIFLYDYDGTTFTQVFQHPVEGAPSWVHFVEPNVLYAVDENGATTSSYTLDLSGSSIEPATSGEGSSGVVHLELNHASTRMVGAGYGAGSIDVWNVEDGEMELIKTIVSDDPLGPNKERQAAAHPHQSVLDPTGRFFAVNDLGTDTILLIDGQDDAFDVVAHVPVTPAGCGPRHGAFYPPDAAVATHYLVVCEIMNVINVYALDYALDTINFKPTQTISTLGHSVVMPNSTAAAGELVVADAENLYVSNRLTGEATDNIAHFKMAAPAAGGNGTALTLTYAGKTSTGGTLPRMFSLSDDGKDLLVGNQDGALGVVALRRGADGVLDATPVATLDAAVFGDKGFGPQFVKQVG